MTTLRRAVWLACMIVAVGADDGALLGQNSGPMTLHAYVNTIQIPVLVLGKNQQRLRRIAASRFSVSFDSGPWFPVTYARLEGDDPISLAILLDVRGNSATSMGMMSDEIAGLAPKWLHPHDLVSVYSLDCVLTGTAHDLPADTTGLKQSVDNALAQGLSRTPVESADGCPHPYSLRDAVAYAAMQLRNSPGQRVLLVVSNGDDESDRYSSDEIKEFAETDVAVFAVRSLSAPSYSPYLQLLHMRGLEDPLFAVCESSGGMVLTADEQSPEKTLQQFTSILRQRYIVEFPRPSNATKGVHNMQVKIDKGADYVVHWAGISVPLANPSLARDPTTVPSDSTHEPEMGTGKVLMPN
jgi:hypothetical protein